MGKDTTKTAAPAADKPTEQTPAPEKKEEKVLTAEEIQSQADEFLSSFNYTPKPREKKEEPKKEEPAPAVEPEKKEDEPPKGEETPETPQDDDLDTSGLLPKPGPKKGSKAKPEAETPAPAPEQIDEDDLAERTAEKILEKQRAEAELNQEEENLDPEDIAVIEAVQVLQANPKFKGQNLEKSTRAFWKAEADYQAKWEQDHPDEDFDPDAKEHRAFYNRNKLPFSEQELTVAQREIERRRLKEEIRQEVQQEVAPELNTLKFDRELAKAKPVIKQEEDRAVAELAATVPEFKALLADEKEGIKIIDKDILAKMQEADPLTVELLSAESKDLRVRIEELEKLNRLGQYYRPDENLAIEGENGVIRPLMEIADLGRRLEKQVQDMPRGEQIQDGRTFITRGELRQQVERIAGKKNLTTEQKQRQVQDLYSRHWFITPDDIKGAFVHQAAVRVKKMREVVKKYGGVHRNGNGQNPSTSPATTDTPPAGKTSETPPPATSSVSDKVASPISSNAPVLTNGEELVKAMF